MSEGRTKVVGTNVLRRQDPKLLTGAGSFVADVKRPGMLHMAILRSPHAHARLRRLDATAARTLSGVSLVLTAADIAGRAQPLPVLRQGRRLRSKPYPVLPADTAIYVGQPIAAAIAGSRAAAEDAVERIEAEWEPLPAVVTMADALRPDATVIHPEFGDNVANRLVHQTGDVETGLREADVVLTREFRIGRVSALPLEGRGVVAEYDRDTERLTLWYSSQAPHLFRTILASTIGFPEHRIHVITREVGGGFGMKLHYFPEEVLAALATLQLRRPVKWIEDRLESFVGSTHAREQVIELTVGARRDGKITAVRAKITGDVGAHLHTKGASPIGNTADVMLGGYDVVNYAVDMTAVFTNKTPFGAYRGFGAPQAFIAMEGMVDLIAAEIGLDPAEVRMRNLLRPEQFPHMTPLGGEYDSGNYPETLRRGLELAGYTRLRDDQRRARAEGKLVGIGVAFPIEIGGQGPCKEMRDRLGILQGGYEAATVRVDTTGQVTVASGIMDTGQGVNTALAQICAEELGVRYEDVEVVLGDTERTPYSAYGNAASRGTALAGVATLQAARLVRQKVQRIAADRLEASPDDIEIVDGQAMVRGAPARAIPLAAIAHDAYLAQRLPEGVGPYLEATFVYDPPKYVFSCAAHIAVVEVDPETWIVTPKAYWVFHDCGTIVNPRQVEGQVMGGVVAGLGEAFFEELVYDGGGQLLTQSLMDYLLPTLNETMPMRLDHMVTPSPVHPTGVKGAAEGGLIGAPATFVCAVADALRPRGIEVRQCPMTPRVLFDLARAAAAEPRR
jgi:carbon-monoxide dehydrogenase large subunit